MSNERHAGGSDRGRESPQADPSPAATNAGSADRYGISNVGFELKESGELAMRLGAVAKSYRGDHLAAQLLLIRERLMALQPNIDATCEYLFEEARKAMNASLSDPNP